ncbi:response regulator receiver protein [Flavobacterium enshiense DK69]|uniref:Transcriptional regulator n=1 Tax=Flavobacterium enshiense DK69 TaxID=1107311 RepID=V6SF72_9FLAO|nr:response regulator transcription factor [Flavobacterium enshiense]ESU25114.1 response regulator receiver protein [Flavobacterium enshiense DK69]KGO96989.1 transcriptional regulator [Flavobacterium enshiense DK69]
MKKVLIIEDDRIIINILNFLLKKEGFEISFAQDGIEGIEKISAIRPDLIISDIMMPYKSGREITLFAKTNFPEIPIIMISSLGKEDQTVIEVANLGVDEFIAKPFDPKELIEKVKALLHPVEA